MIAENAVNLLSCLLEAVREAWPGSQRFLFFVCLRGSNALSEEVRSEVLLIAGQKDQEPGGDLKLYVSSKDDNQKHLL